MSSHTCDTSAARKGGKGPRRKITVALAGNPNCGKTTAFNALTGADQVVGNWSGVTVQRLEGHYSRDDVDVTVVDLPGIYSMAAGTLDENIAQNYILQERPDAVVNIVDASNLQRNLYLTAQLLEMPAPVIVALNMMDVVRRRGVEIDVEHLQRHLGCPVVELTASRGEGIDRLKEAISACRADRVPSVRVSYDSEVEEALAELVPMLEEPAASAGMDARRLAVRLLLRDEQAMALAGDEADRVAAEQARCIEQHVGDEIAMVIADGRHGFARGLARDVVRETILNRRRVSDVIDKIVLNRVLCFPIFAAVMYLMFSVTISLSAPFVDFFDGLGSAVLVDGVRSLLVSVSSPRWLILLLADGIGGGMTTVATFIPPITMIFMCLSILSDSGYMARAAFVMDRVLRPLGLPGKAFLPMLVGFGCNVPGIMAARVLEDKRDRILSILANPFMSCGARLPVYSFFAVAFFSAAGAGLMVFALYAVGILVGLLTTLLVGRTLVAGETSSFVMELPPYHRPTVRGVLHHTWNNLKGFIIRAGKVIIFVVVILSLITGWGAQAEDGALNRAGSALTPIFRPMGISDKNWPAVVALFSGIFAKEAVVGSLTAMYEQMDVSGGQTSDVTDEQDAGEAGGASLPAALGDVFKTLGSDLAAIVGLDGEMDELSGEQPDEHRVYGVMASMFASKAAAVAYLVFVLLYVPCIAVVAAIYQEIGLGWAVFSVLYQSLLAWTGATMVYQVCRLGSDPASAALWLSLCAAMITVAVLVMKAAGRRLAKVESGL